MEKILKTFSGAPACQDYDEFTQFIEYIKRLTIIKYLEIGVARGDTFHAVMSSLPPSSFGFAIDAPQQQWGIKQSNTFLDAAKADLDLKYKIQICYGSSQDKAAIEAAEKAGPFDMVFIDGDHSYRGVAEDWFNYGRLGKYVVFHDISNDMKPNKKGEVIEVPLFWDKIKKDHKHVEFINPASNMGIGIIIK